MNRVCPYYYPTSVAFVDDDRMFLENLVVGLEDGFAAELFDSPQRALSELEANALQPRVHETCLSARRDLAEGGEHVMTDRLVAVTLSHIPAAMADWRRFNEISVAVIDYAMPGINGLDLCRRIETLPVRKILLTGRADERTAIDAFNHGIIDRFIEKSDPRALARLNAEISGLQEAYFAARTQMVIRALGEQAPPFFADPAFADLFANIRRRSDIVEYYLDVELPGFQLLDQHGHRHLLVVLTAEDLRGQREIAADQNAPADLLEVLSDGSMVPFFHDSDGFYGPACEDWQRYLYPAQRVKGRTDYYCALIAEPPDRLPFAIIAFEEYLERRAAG